MSKVRSPLPRPANKQDDETLAGASQFALAAVAFNALQKFNYRLDWTHPGMHANFFINGVLGFIYYQKFRVGKHFYISSLASKYLGLPFLLADIYWDHSKVRSILHLFSGIIPLSVACYYGKEPTCGDILIKLNVISLAYYAWMTQNKWAWLTSAAAVFAFFVAPNRNIVECACWVSFKSLIPFSLALMEYFAYKLYWSRTPISPPPIPKKRKPRIPGAR